MYWFEIVTKMSEKVHTINIDTNLMNAMDDVEAVLKNSISTKQYNHSFDDDDEEQQSKFIDIRVKDYYTTLLSFSPKFISNN